MKTPVDWFNDQEEVTPYLESLETLQALVGARIKHAAQAGKGNEAFVVFGRFFLGPDLREPIKLIRPSLLEKFPTIPDVIALEKFEELARPCINFFRDFSLSEYFIPHRVNVCEACGAGWNIRNCHDIKFLQRHESSVDLNGWVGRKLGEAKDHFLAPIGSHIRFLRRQGWMFNQQMRFKENEKGIDIKPGDDYIIQQNDRLSIETYSIFHADCFRSHVLKERTAAVQNLFLSSGFGDIWPEVVAKKAVQHLGLAITWRVHTFFGALEVTEKSEGNYEVSGHLCGRELWRMLYGGGAVRHYWHIGGNSKEMVLSLSKIYEIIRKEGQK